MKQKTYSLLMAAILMVSGFALSAQKNPGVRLCQEAATTIVTAEKPDKCCEECLQQRFMKQMRKGITHMKLCLSQPGAILDCDSLLPLADTLSGNFDVISISSIEGYCLENNELKKKTFYLLSLRDYSLDDRSDVTWVVDNPSGYDVGKTYYLRLKPYFDKNQTYTRKDGKVYEIVGSGHTLMDIVYKNWLLLKIPSGKNLYFTIERSCD